MQPDGGDLNVPDINVWDASSAPVRTVSCPFSLSSNVTVDPTTAPVMAALVAQGVPLNVVCPLTARPFCCNELLPEYVLLNAFETAVNCQLPAMLMIGLPVFRAAVQTPLSPIWVHGPLGTVYVPDI